jgi:hypothetical protein
MDKNREINEWIARNVFSYVGPFESGGVAVWIGAWKNYTTDMNAAMEVVAKMRERGWRFDMGADPDGEYMVSFGHFDAWHENPALTICLAARAAIEGGQP